MVIFLLIPTLVHLVLDSIQILYRKKEVNHEDSALITILVGIPCGLIFLLAGGQNFFQPVLAMLCFHYAFFSLSLNIVRMIAGSLPREFHSLTYLGKGAIWDRLLENVPKPMLLFSWIFIAAVGFCIVYKWDWISYGY